MHPDGVTWIELMAVQKKHWGGALMAQKEKYRWCADGARKRIDVFLNGECERGEQQVWDGGGQLDITA